MSNICFNHKKVELHGINVPDFQLKKGELIRIYDPRIYSTNVPSGFDLTVELIKRFQNQKPDFPWAKNYSQHNLMAFFSPLTVQSYLTKKMHISTKRSNKIIKELGLGLLERFDNLNLTKKKALIIRANFEKKNCILFDYYGVDAAGIMFLERIVNLEIEKGKSAIGFDNLSYAHEKEPYENIIPIKIII